MYENMSVHKERENKNLDKVEADILVEGVKDEFGQPVVAPRAVHQQQASQETKLRGDANDLGSSTR